MLSSGGKPKYKCGKKNKHIVNKNFGNQCCNTWEVYVTINRSMLLTKGVGTPGTFVPEDHINYLVPEYHINY